MRTILKKARKQQTVEVSIHDDRQHDKNFNPHRVDGHQNNLESAATNYLAWSTSQARHRTRKSHRSESGPSSPGAKQRTVENHRNGNT